MLDTCSEESRDGLCVGRKKELSEEFSLQCQYSPTGTDAYNLRTGIAENLEVCELIRVPKREIIESTYCSKNLNCILNIYIHILKYLQFQLFPHINTVYLEYQII